MEWSLRIRNLLCKDCYNIPAEIESHENNDNNIVKNTLWLAGTHVLKADNPVFLLELGQRNYKMAWRASEFTRSRLRRERRN